jgi:hypothetical protein
MGHRGFIPFIAGTARVLPARPQEAAVADPTSTERDPKHDLDHQLERIHAQRAELKNRHAHALSRLFSEREDLRGVHALADLVSDSLRWSA